MSVINSIGFAIHTIVAFYANSCMYNKRQLSQGGINFSLLPISATVSVLLLSLKITFQPWENTWFLLLEYYITFLKRKLADGPER